MVLGITSAAIGLAILLQSCNKLSDLIISGVVVIVVMTCVFYKEFKDDKNGSKGK